MSKLTTETIELLDKVYNLRGSESTIIVKLEQEMDDAANNYEETNQIRRDLDDTIQKLNADVEELSEQGEKFKSIFNNVSENEFDKLLNTLKIDFHPDEIKEKLDSLLPVTINGLANDIKMSSKELSRVEDKLQEIQTDMEEYSIRKEEALVNQDRLNQYFDLALKSNINVTRDELTNLFAQFNLSEEESRECAKLLMFPEDGLFEYEKDYKNTPKSVKEKIKEEIKEEVEDNNEVIVEPIEVEESPITFIEEEEPAKEDVISEVEEKEETKEDYVNDFIVENIDIESPIVEEPIIEESIVEEPAVEELTIANPKPDKEEVINYLTSLGFDALDFTTNDIEKLADNYNPELILNNVNAIKEMGINLDVFADNIELLYDKEMKSKIDKLTEVGKLPQDIYLNPNVLTKYNLMELDSAIKVLQDSGLEPKNVPLMAY